VLDTGLPRACDKPIYEQKCSALIEHIHESSPGLDAGMLAVTPGLFSGENAV
jgi:type I restriction enzyme R subunit